MKPSPRSVSAERARRLLEEATQPIARREQVPLAQAAGRILAESLRAPEDVPAHPRAVMDGYAVRSADVAGAADGAPICLRVVGRVSMGDSAACAVRSGEAVEIPTGGLLPEGADAVVMIEHTQPRGVAEVLVQRPVEIGRNVIHAGEDIGRGALVVSAGRRIGTREIAALALFGTSSVTVYARPRVAILSTGSELCAIGDAPRAGQFRDVNQPVLAAEAVAAGAEVTCAGIVQDEPGALRAAVARLLPRQDLILLTGGSSVGGKDFTAEVLAGFAGGGTRPGANGLLFHGIDVRPGRPTLAVRAGEQKEKLLVGLPGVPTSALVIFTVFIRPVLWRLAGEGTREAWPVRRRARLASVVPSVVGREDYVRVRFETREGTLWALPLPGGSAALGNVLFADGLVRVDATSEGIAAGEEVDVWLLGG
jgi:molybdopterin molybdotransferase